MHIAGHFQRAGHFPVQREVAIDRQRAGKRQAILCGHGDTPLYVDGHRAHSLNGEGVGRAIDDENMQADGLAQQAKGKTQKAVGDAKDAVKNVVDKA